MNYSGSNENSVVCSRCGGTGYLPQFRHIEDGVCFKCGGSGYVSSRYRYGRRHQEDYDSDDAARDTFYALTDGACGDYEDWGGSDGYKDFMGF